VAVTGDEASSMVEIEVEDFTFQLVRSAGSKRKRLSRRETDICLLVSRGLSNKEIAQELSISCFTVASHLRKIFQKIGVSSRAAIARNSALFTRRPDIAR
jgi:DNA-binding CsgD family transcriptional regulator